MSKETIGTTPGIEWILDGNIHAMVRPPDLDLGGERFLICSRCVTREMIGASPPTTSTTGIRKHPSNLIQTPKLSPLSSQCPPQHISYHRTRPSGHRGQAQKLREEQHPLRRRHTPIDLEAASGPFGSFPWSIGRGLPGAGSVGGS